MRFSERLETIVNTCVDLNLGEWINNGNIFHVKDLVIFEKCIKPYSITTLKRQLNYYGFKYSFSFEKGFTFQHSGFTRDLKKEIVRKVQSPAQNEQRRKQENNYRYNKRRDQYKLIQNRIDSLEEQTKKLNNHIEYISKKLCESIVHKNKHELEHELEPKLEKIENYFSGFTSRCPSPIQEEEFENLIKNSEMKLN